MSELSRQDSVIVSPGNRGAKLYYVPYLIAVERLAKFRYRVSYNGGEIEIDLQKAESILFYGASGQIPVEFLDACNESRVPLTFHRTHQSEPYVLAPSPMSGRADLITQQILKREDARLRIYLARLFSGARVLSLGWLMPLNATALSRIRTARTLQDLRRLEAEQAARYWEAFYEKAGFADRSRRGDSLLSKALDAALLLVRGTLLRWTLHHRLSPAHGYLHEPTGYPALVFDLIEPYRYLVERAVLESFLDSTSSPTVAKAVEYTKTALKAAVYVPATRQWVPAKSLLHGVVLALRAYLGGEMTRFVPPIAGEPKAGRPYRTTYRLPAALDRPPSAGELLD